MENKVFKGDMLNANGRKKLVLKIAAIVTVIGTLQLTTVRGNAVNDFKPWLTAKQQNNYATLTSNIDIASTDIIYDLSVDGFDLDCGGSLGNQSVTNIDNSRVLRLTDTVTNQSGNYHPNLLADKGVSKFYINERLKNLTQGTYLAVVYKAKATGATIASIHPYMDYECRLTGEPQRGVDSTPVKYRDRIDWNNPPEFIYLKNADSSTFRDGLDYIIATSTKGNNRYGGYRVKWDAAHSRFVNYRGYSYNQDGRGSDKEVFNAGDTMLFCNTDNKGGGARDVTDSSWKTYAITIPLDINNYDYSGIGEMFNVMWKTNGILYIKDIKMGYASQVELYRSNTANGAYQQVYKGYNSEITDKEANVLPNKAVVAGITNANSVTFNFEAAKLQKTYYYKARSLSRRNEYSSFSTPINVTLTSVPVGYTVVVDNKPYTDPGKSISKNYTTKKTLTTEGWHRGDKVYCHIRTYDSNKQWSEPIHYSYIVGQTLKDYKGDIKGLEKDSAPIAKAYSYSKDVKDKIRDNVTKEAEKLRTNPRLNSYKPHTNSEDVKEPSEFKDGEVRANVYLKNESK